MAVEPAAFMSYVRFNDEHDNGQITQFRKRLSYEVEVQTGESFPIFQDRDITWGQNWQQRINEALDAATLLLVIITPSLFHSQPCRHEVTQFLEREHALGQDLILPVYYISSREMDDPALRAADEMAQVLASRQWADWRELRFKRFTSSGVYKVIADLASQIGDALAPSVAQKQPAERAREVRSPGGLSQPARVAGQARAKTEPLRIVVVDANQEGAFDTLSAAIQAAKPGDLIVVRSELYKDGLVMGKSLEIPVVGKASAGPVDMTAKDLS